MGELRRPDMAKLAGRALIDEGFRQFLKNDPLAAAADSDVILDEEDVQWLRRLPWNNLRAHARMVADDLPEAERLHYSW